MQTTQAVCGSVLWLGRRGENEAIRAKDGTSATFPIQNAPDRIAAIPSGGGSITMTSGSANVNNGSITSSFFTAHDVVVGLATGTRGDAPTGSPVVSAFLISNGAVVMVAADNGGTQYVSDRSFVGLSGNVLANANGYLITGSYLLFGFDVA